MKTFKWLICSAALAMIAATAALLVFIKQHQALGEPGVRVGPVPIYGADGKVVGKQSVILPESILGSKSMLASVAKQEVEGLPADTTFGRRVYCFTNGFTNSVSVVLMGVDRTSIHQPQFCLVGQGWSIDRTEEVAVRMDRPYPYDLGVMKLSCSVRYVDEKKQPVLMHGIYVYWFVAKDRLCTGPFDRMWSTIKTLFTSCILERWAYVSYFSACAPGEEDACFDRLKQIIAASVPDFQLAAGSALSQREPGK